MPPEIMDRLRESVTPICKDGEHRLEDRVPVGTTVSVTVTPVDVYSSICTMTMRVADYSGGGIGLLYGESVAIGSDVTVHLKKRDGDGRYNLRCVVANCRGVADGVFRVGVRFEGLEK